MFFSDPTYSGEDAIRVLERWGEPLHFNSLDECGEHVTENLFALRQYGKAVYPQAVSVKQIICVPKSEDEA